MATMRYVMIGLTAMGAVALAPRMAAAQEDPDSIIAAVADDAVLEGVTVHLVVDGMVCPFCAYGLQKRLQKLAAVDSLIVRVSDGLVQIREKEGQQLTPEVVEHEVERAGFSLREMKRIDR